ncbi:MAG: U32 family peptidase, partial [Lachnospiraceae bacterium]|nr:U32 family peptidase [Lachnospiraceae bacterium]
MQRAEVLAPAGDINCLKAAVNAGCDAVYIGGSMFSARYKAGIDYEDMAYGIRYAHLHDKKIYLTVNTLLKNCEIEKELYDFIKTYYHLGIDAVIVQDLGVLNFINYHFNDLELHASTQMTLNTHYAYDYLKKYNVTRIVTPRELSLTEIKRIKDETNLSIETFVHGALCYGYSGQCMLSSLNGKRSGNRGRCAQICRKCYTYDNKKSYILSLKDLLGLSNIGELIENGVDSLKIEGRMKKPEYVALVSNIYRQYVDYYYEYGVNKKVSEEDIIKLSDIYNRGSFTKGFYHIHNDGSMLSDKRPNHYGTLVGRVINIKGNSCTIEFNKNVNPHDVLMIRSDSINDNDNNTYEFTLKNGFNKGDKFNAPFTKGKKLRPGQQVFRMRNEDLINDITDKYIKNDKKVPVNAKFTLKKGKEAVLSINDTVKVYGNIAEEAKSSGVTEEQVKKQLSKLGDTAFVYNKLAIDMDDNLFIPMGSINKLRREAFLKYEEYLFEKDKRNTDNIKPLKSIKEINSTVKQEIAVSVADSEQLEAVLKFDF